MMKKFACLSFLVVCAGLFNVGCAASGSIKPTSATAVTSDSRVAYVVAVDKR